MERGERKEGMNFAMNKDILSKAWENWLENNRFGIDFSLFFSFLYLEIRVRHSAHSWCLMIYAKCEMQEWWRKTTWNTWLGFSRIDTWEEPCRSADKAPGDIRQRVRNKRSVGVGEDRRDRREGTVWEMERSAITCLPAGGMCSTSLLVESYLFMLFGLGGFIDARACP